MTSQLREEQGNRQFPSLEITHRLRARVPENSEISPRPASTFPFRNSLTYMHSERHPASEPPIHGCVPGVGCSGTKQRGQQETVSSELAKVQRGNFLERHEDVTEQGSELLVGQVGTLARMNRTGDEEVSQGLYLSTAPSGSLCHLLILSHLPLYPVFLYLCIFFVFSFSPSPSDYL